MSGATDTLMWEARAAAGRLAELEAWVDGTAVPALRAAGVRRVEAYRGGEDRAVLIVHGAAGTRIPDPPPELLARPAHEWSFLHRRIPVTA